MLHLVKQFWTTLTGKRNRALLWAFVACLVIGTLEISSPLDDVMRVMRMYATVNALTALGVTVSIDDYGTGYCTLEYLKTIKATELKIDRGFVAAMDHNRSDRVLVNATIELAHSLGHSVVAEGVETLETLDLLKSMGCDKAQGFFISRPMPREEFFQFVDRQVRPEAA